MRGRSLLYLDSEPPPAGAAAAAGFLGSQSPPAPTTSSSAPPNEGGPSQAEEWRRRIPNVNATTSAPLKWSVVATRRWCHPVGSGSSNSLPVLPRHWGGAHFGRLHHWPLPPLALYRPKPHAIRLYRCGDNPMRTVSCTCWGRHTFHNSRRNWQDNW